MEVKGLEKPRMFLNTVPWAFVDEEYAAYRENKRWYEEILMLEGFGEPSPFQQTVIAVVRTLSGILTNQP